MNDRPISRLARFIHTRTRAMPSRLNIFILLSTTLPTIGNDLFMWAVKRLMERQGKNAQVWDTVSLFDSDRHFRGSAVFEDKHSAKEYLKYYEGIVNKKRHKERQTLRVFDLDESAKKEKKGRPPKSKSRSQQLYEKYFA